MSLGAVKMKYLKNAVFGLMNGNKIRTEDLYVKYMKAVSEL